MKQGPSDIWTRWSAWSPCLKSCRTYRYRRCRKSRICHREVQKEEALCYHEESNCELFVLELLENTNKVTGKKLSWIPGSLYNLIVINSYVAKYPGTSGTHLSLQFKKQEINKSLCWLKIHHKYFTAQIVPIPSLERRAPSSLSFL